MVLHCWGVQQDNLVLSVDLIAESGHPRVFLSWCFEH